MKIRSLLLAAFHCIASSCLSQDERPEFQIGFTGLPIIYLSQNSGLGEAGIEGFAFYFNYGKIFSKHASAGLRPFIGSVKGGANESLRLA